MVKTFGLEPDAAKRIRTQQGKTMREVRELRGLSIKELADSIGVTHGAVSHWECGRVSPRQHHQVEIARTLGVPWSTIFGLDSAVVA